MQSTTSLPNVESLNCPSLMAHKSGIFSTKTGTPEVILLYSEETLKTPLAYIQQHHCPSATRPSLHISDLSKGERPWVILPVGSSDLHICFFIFTILMFSFSLRRCQSLEFWCFLWWLIEINSLLLGFQVSRFRESSLRSCEAMALVRFHFVYAFVAVFFWDVHIRSVLEFWV